MSQSTLSSVIENTFCPQWMLFAVNVTCDVFRESSKNTRSNPNQNSLVQKISRAVNNRKEELIPYPIRHCYYMLKATPSFCVSVSMAIVDVVLNLKNFESTRNLNAPVEKYAWCGKRKLSVDNLTKDNLEEVFKYLSPEDLITCLKVCKKWKEVILTPSFLKKHNASYDFPEYILNKIITPSLHVENNVKTVFKSSEFYKILISAGLLYTNIKYIQKASAEVSSEVTKWKSVPVITKHQWMEKCNELINYFRFHSYDKAKLNELTDIIKFDIGLGNRFEFGYSYGREYSSIWEFHEKAISHMESGPSEMKLYSSIFWIYQLYSCYCSFSSMYREYPQRKNAQWLKTLSVPSKLEHDPALVQDRCHSSGRIPLIPVRDRCGHLFDFVIVKYASATCPTTHQKIISKEVNFDGKLFKKIQKQFNLMIKDANLLDCLLRNDRPFRNVQRIPFVHFLAED